MEPAAEKGPKETNKLPAEEARCFSLRQWHKWRFSFIYFRRVIAVAAAVAGRRDCRVHRGVSD